ncbi:hypothetical protein TSOC_009710 [Tetrabaena socialis]|uniref:Uncharacterized protein n=1 Tax=Tetrabaena socialis TaxID=47790 RepID=A0A2J7ZV74_9CHLO|nr:hypothetical protein TSOC_009710 [Tetrabaena socialis]|eukprot:PNH04159.1 hypothetical protein TSOC_009710 [Tetrabaena socialis]
MAPSSAQRLHQGGLVQHRTDPQAPESPLEPPHAAGSETGSCGGSAEGSAAPLPDAAPHEVPSDCACPYCGTAPYAVPLPPLPPRPSSPSPNGGGGSGTVKSPPAPPSRAARAAACASLLRARRACMAASSRRITQASEASMTPHGTQQAVATLKAPCGREEAKAKRGRAWMSPATSTGPSPLPRSSVMDCRGAKAKSDRAQTTSANNGRKQVSKQGPRTWNASATPRVSGSLTLSMTERRLGPATDAMAPPSAARKQLVHEGRHVWPEGAGFSARRRAAAAQSYDHAFVRTRVASLRLARPPHQRQRRQQQLHAQAPAARPQPCPSPPPSLRAAELPPPPLAHREVAPRPAAPGLTGAA